MSWFKSRIGVITCLGGLVAISGCTEDAQPEGRQVEEAVVEATPQFVEGRYYGYVNPSTGVVKFSDKPISLDLEDGKSALSQAGHLVPGQFGEVVVVQDSTANSNPSQTFELQGGAAALDDAAQSAGQTQCPGQNFTIDITLKHFFDLASLEDVYVEFTHVSPGPTHYPFDTDSIPGGLPLDNTYGVYSYGTLDNSNSNASSRTWKFERCTTDPFVFEFAVLGTCVPEVGKSALEACGDNPSYKRLVAGNQFSCFKGADNVNRCWGNNSQGQLTTGDTTSSSTPVSIKREQGDEPAVPTRVVLGKNHSCMVLDNKYVNCWGSNAEGQLGDNTVLNSASPIPVLSQADIPLTGVDDLALGDGHSCALTTSGGVQCWGANNAGQLGTNSLVSSDFPVDVVGVGGSGTLSGVVQVAANGFNTCAVLDTSEVVCWGLNNRGQLGNGSTTSRSTIPVYVSDGAGGTLQDVVQVSLGTYHACAVTSIGEAVCWGYNGAGQLGDGATVDKSVPVAVKDETGTGFLTGVSQVAAGRLHSCALLSNGEARCWGKGGFLGNGSTATSKIPVVVSDPSGSGALSNGVAISSYLNTSCVSFASGGVACWGSNTSGQIGDGTTSTRLIPSIVSDDTGMTSLGSVQGISSGDAHTCAFRSDASIQCWGSNSGGQLGDGTTTSSVLPVFIDFQVESYKSVLRNSMSIVSGDSHSCALMNSGVVKCWGANNAGQLGTNSLVPESYPTDVLGVGGSGTLSGVVQVAANGFNTCAVLDTSEVVCWGLNNRGQLGNGSTTSRSTIPVYVVRGAGNLQDVIHVSLGTYHACAVTSIGEAVCWGYNGAGQLGDGTTISQSIPVTVKDETGTGFLTGVSQVAAGRLHSCALLSNGEARCWGKGGFLGNGSTATSKIPVVVSDPSGSGALSNGLEIVVSYDHALFLIDNGEVVSWGSNVNGQLGDGSTSIRLAPVFVKNDFGSANLTAVQNISAGYNHSCAFMADRSVMCWGGNAEGQLGDGTTTSSVLPVTVTGL